MTAMEQKKKSGKKTTVETLDNGAVVITAEPERPFEDAVSRAFPVTDEEKESAKLHVVEEPAKPKAKPGDPGFDWQEEYPGEEIYVYTVPQDAKKSPAGKQSPPGLTIGLCRLTEDRAPNPGEMQDAYEAGGFAPMWLFIAEVSSPASRKLQKLLRPAEYNEMLRGWAKFAGIELSE
jgi:hypothetical protein